MSTNLKPADYGSTFADCLSDFFKKPDSVKILADFTGAPLGTVRHWKNGVIPSAERYLRTAYFLELIGGYKIAELEVLDTSIHMACGYISLDVLSVTDFARGIELNRVRRVYDYLSGGIKTSPKRLEKIKKLLMDKVSIFDQKKSEALLKFGTIDKNVTDNSSETEKLIEEFEAACTKTRELGRRLLNGPRVTRFSMRVRIGQGKEPLLYTTWETLHKLLAERGEIKPQPKPRTEL